MRFQTDPFLNTVLIPTTTVKLDRQHPLAHKLRSLWIPGHPQGRKGALRNFALGPPAGNINTVMPTTGTAPNLLPSPIGPVANFAGAGYYRATTATPWQPQTNGVISTTAALVSVTGSLTNFPAFYGQSETSGHQFMSLIPSSGALCYDVATTAEVLLSGPTYVLGRQ
jgi:hypothetical protein